MDKVLEVLQNVWRYKDHVVQTMQILAYVIAIASVVVKITPTIKDDNFLKKIILLRKKLISESRAPRLRRLTPSKCTMSTPGR